MAAPRARRPLRARVGRPALPPLRRPRRAPVRHHPITRTSCSVTLSLTPASTMFALTLGPNPSPNPSPSPSPNPSPDPNSALASLTRLGIDNVLARIGVDRAGMLGSVRVCSGLFGSVRDRVRVRVRDTGVDRAGVRPVAQPHASRARPNPEPLALTLTPTLTPPPFPNPTQVCGSCSPTPCASCRPPPRAASQLPAAA